MGLFDDVSDIGAGGGERGVQVDPDAVASTWDALSEYTDAVTRRAADDPVGTVLAGGEAVSPPPSIEVQGDAE